MFETSPQFQAVGTNTAYGTELNLLSSLMPKFLAYGRYECSFSKETIQKYEGCVKHMIKDLGDIPIEKIDMGHIAVLKQKMFERGVTATWVATNTYVIKHLLRYCNDSLGIHTLEPHHIKAPKRPRREVVYLSNEEIQQFINSIKLENAHHNGKAGKFINIDGLRFRALVEVLLGSAMRISEALSLNRDSINYEKLEAKIIGKGNKERVVFFNDRAIQWVKYYLEQRTDNWEPLFVTDRGTRLARADVSRVFQGYVKKSGITKKLTPHILRHTTATNLLFNGCPMAHIKEILGHERLETTCRYYLGLDRTKAKEAHKQFLNYGPPPKSPTPILYN